MSETTVRAGDTLIIVVPPATTHETAARVREHAKASLPDVEVVVIAATQAIVYPALGGLANRLEATS